MRHGLKMSGTIFAPFVEMVVSGNIEVIVVVIVAFVLDYAGAN